MAETVLRLQSISKYYYSDTSVTQALRKVSLAFEMGEFVAITGESGSGKSTLLNMISGLDTFDEGEMYFKGEPTFQYDDQDWEEYRRNQIGFVFQDYSLINHYTTLDNVLAALVIQGKNPAESKEEALHYLEQVGLKELARQRASELSSGQKQRLAIARALAKNTDIIVADEPTGNLDSETGEQVIEILEKLSHEKLVIMVTHNYDQAAPYVTRRIRLHDGEVVTDVPVNGRGKNVNQDGETKADTPSESGAGEAKADTPSESGAVKKKEKRSGKNKAGRERNYISSFFALQNIKMQRGRAFIFFSFFLITAVISFLFLGEIFVFADDRITKEYDPEAYLQQNDTRLVVRYPDNRTLTKEDQAAICAVKHVEEVDLYDYANDINYYIEKDRDYKTYFGDLEKVEQENPVEGEEQETEYEKVQGIRLVDKSHFMRSSSALTEDDLAAGHLPKAHNEIVLYSANDKRLDREQECYFSSDNLWEPGESCHQKLKIVGLLKEKTEQVYFHPELCQMLTFSLDNFGFTADFCWDFRYKEYRGKFTPCFIVVSDELEDTQVRVSKNYELPSTGYGLLPSSKEKAFPGRGQIHLSQKANSLSEEEIATARYAGLLDDTEYAQSQDTESEEQLFQIEYTNDFSDQGADFIEVSEALYKQFRDIYNVGTMQGSVYIDNYSKTDRVVRDLQEKGYDAVSTFRVSATKYVQEEVYKRLEVIGISCLVLLLLMLLQILILRSILKIKEKDYHVLRFMGMQLKQMRGITYEEMGIHCAVAIVAAIVLVGILHLAQVSFIQNMVAYYTPLGGALYIIYNVLLMLLTVFFFNRMLRRSVN